MNFALAAAFALSSVFAQQFSPRQVHLGESAEGRSIDGYWLGPGGAPVVLLVGGMHGGPELNSSNIVWRLLDHFVTAGAPPHLRLLFVPEANPDGLADGTRELADGVDPNRNFPTSDWQPGTYGPGKWLPDGGGDEPLSEPETILLAQMVERTHPRAVFSYHSAGGIVMGGGLSQATGILSLYAETAGYPAQPFLAYPVTGDFAQWCDELGIPTVEVELSDHLDAEVDRNLSGVEAVLTELSSRVADPRY